MKIYSLVLLFINKCDSSQLIFFKKSFMAPFYGQGLTALRLDPLRGGSLLFTPKFREIPGKQPLLLKLLHIFLAPFFSKLVWIIASFGFSLSSLDLHANK